MRAGIVTAAIVAAVSVSVVTACARVARHVAAASVAPEPALPFDDTPVSFLVAALHFTPGEAAIVRVCISAQRAIISADLVGSSGDKRFDDLALVWARQIKLRSAPQGGTPESSCGAVRVEIQVAPEPRVVAGPDISLG